MVVNISVQRRNKEGLEDRVEAMTVFYFFVSKAYAVLLTEDSQNVQKTNYRVMSDIRFPNRLHYVALRNYKII